MTIKQETKELDNDTPTFSTNIKPLKLEEELADKELKQLFDNSENIKGSFKLQSDDMMLYLKLKRQIHHKRALNENDISKLCKASNTEKLIKVFVVVDIKTPTAPTSSSQESQK